MAKKCEQVLKPGPLCPQATVSSQLDHQIPESSIFSNKMTNRILLHNSFLDHLFLHLKESSQLIQLINSLSVLTDRLSLIKRDFNPVLFKFNHRSGIRAFEPLTFASADESNNLQSCQIASAFIWTLDEAASNLSERFFSAAAKLFVAEFFVYIRLFRLLRLFHSFLPLSPSSYSWFFLD